MRVTVNADVTWDNKPKEFANQSEKFFKKLFKMFCEAQHVQINSIEASVEEEDNDE